MLLLQITSGVVQTRPVHPQDPRQDDLESSTLCHSQSKLHLCKCLPVGCVQRLDQPRVLFRFHFLQQGSTNVRNDCEILCILSPILPLASFTAEAWSSVKISIDEVALVPGSCFTKTSDTTAFTSFASTSAWRALIFPIGRLPPRCSSSIFVRKLEKLFLSFRYWYSSFDGWMSLRILI